jgi:hypothetical protein
MSQPGRAHELPTSHPESRERPERPGQRLRLVHHHPGYLRIQADAFTHPADGGSAVPRAEAAARALPGLRSWSHNPRTRSVVVEYDPGALEADDLLGRIAERAGFLGVENATRSTRNREELVSALLDAAQAVNDLVGQLTGERADLREVVPAALVATSIVSFVLHGNRGRLPSWHSALYHSYRIFMQWHRREVRARESAAWQEEASGR